MRLGVLSFSVSLLAVGAADVTTAYASDGSRFAGIGAGVTYASEQQALNADRPDSVRTVAVPATVAAPAHADPVARSAAPARRGLVGFDRFGAKAGRTGLDAITRDGSTGQGDVLRTASGGSAPLPPDLSAIPRPLGEPQSDRPSPMIAARDIGGVVGFSYKIKPQ